VIALAIQAMSSHNQATEIGTYSAHLVNISQVKKSSRPSLKLSLWPYSLYTEALSVLDFYKIHATFCIAK
jgi:hypothetical protein